MKLLYSVLLSVFLLSIVSASSIAITPAQVTFAGYPNAIFCENLTISTSGNYAVYLNFSSNRNITVNYTTPLIVEGSKIVPVCYYFPGDIETGDYQINISAKMEVEETIITVTQNGVEYLREGGSYICVAPNGSITYKYPCPKYSIPETNQTRIAELENKILELEEIPQQTKEIERANALLKYLFWIGLTLIVLGILGFIIKNRLFKK